MSETELIASVIDGTIVPTQALAAAMIFRDLDPKVLAPLEAAARIHSLAPGDTAPDGAAAIHVVLAGRVGVFHPDELFGRRRLAEIGPGDTIGEFAVISGFEGRSDWEAVAPTIVASIPGPVFLAFLRREPDVALRLLQKVVGLVRAMDAELAALAGHRETSTAIYRQLVRLTL